MCFKLLLKYDHDIKQFQYIWENVISKLVKNALKKLKFILITMNLTFNYSYINFMYRRIDFVIQNQMIQLDQTTYWVNNV